MQRETRELKTLLKISEAINYDSTWRRSPCGYSKLIGEAVPAVTGALLTLNYEDEVGDELGSTFALELKAGEGKEARMSITISRQI